MRRTVFVIAVAVALAVGVEASAAAAPGAGGDAASAAKPAKKKLATKKKCAKKRGPASKRAAQCAKPRKQPRRKARVLPNPPDGRYVDKANGVDFRVLSRAKRFSVTTKLDGGTCPESERLFTIEGGLRGSEVNEYGVVGTVTTGGQTTWIVRLSRDTLEYELWIGFNRANESNQLLCGTSAVLRGYLVKAR